ncbi:hypothetical protein [Pectobacterium versatile]|uniref:hypothetical protein n=1 Tax=Pectobacterium versatile TaxID=2488639 RepID=UPI0038105764
MKYFRWEFLKRHINITHFIAFSFGVIVICFFDALVFEKSIADWVIAVANVCMAFAAGFAAIRAKKWFDDKTSINNLDAAHAFALEFERTLYETHQKIYSDSTLRYDITLRLKGINFNKDKELKYITELIEQEHNIEFTYKSKVLTKKTMLCRYNIEISEKLEKLSSKILEMRTEYIKFHILFLHNLRMKLVSDTLGEHDYDQSIVIAEMIKLGKVFEIELSNSKINEDYKFKP